MDYGKVYGGRLIILTISMYNWISKHVGEKKKKKELLNTCQPVTSNGGLPSLRIMREINAMPSLDDAF